MTKYISYFIFTFLVLPFSISTAKTTSGTVIINGKVLLPACSINMLNDGSNGNLTINSETNSTLSIPSIEYSNLVLASALNTEFGMAVGQTRPMTNSQFASVLNRIYQQSGGNVSNGFAKASIRIICPDPNLFSNINFNIQEASGNVSTASLPFNSSSNALASNSLEMHSFIIVDQSPNSYVHWNDYRQTSTRTLSNGGTGLNINLNSSYMDLSSFNIITRKSSAITNIGATNMNYSATQQITFTYN